MATESDLIELRLIQVDEDDVRAMGESSLERAIARRGEAHPYRLSSNASVNSTI